LGKELGKDRFKNPRNARKCPQTAGVRRRRFRVWIQEAEKSFEEDRKSRVQILSLLRMPISPLRLREGLGERNTCQMNQSTARLPSDFQAREFSVLVQLGKELGKDFLTSASSS
jgi:hypothetical protein